MESLTTERTNWPTLIILVFLGHFWIGSLYIGLAVTLVTLVIICTMDFPDTPTRQWLVKDACTISSIFLFSIAIVAMTSSPRC